MRAIVACIVMALRPIVVAALIALSCFAFLNRSLSVRDVIWSLTVGVVTFIVIEGIGGVLMTLMYSRRHGDIPEGASIEPIDEFDIFY